MKRTRAGNPLFLFWKRRITMDKQRVLVEVKQDMKQLIEEMQFETKGVTQQNLGRYFHFIDALNDLPHVNTPIVARGMIEVNPIVATGEVAVAKAPEAPVSGSISFGEEEPESETKVYEFVRNIKGGTLKGTSIFIPEKIIRELQLRHGDLLTAEPIESDDEFGPPHYDFNVVEHRNGADPRDRVQINYCIVERDALLDRYVINRTINDEDIRIDEAPQKILISEKDVIDMQIREDDVVDIAYNPNQTNYMRVIWRHTTGENGQVSKPVVRKKEKEVKEKKEYPQSLEGKTVLMVGFEPGKTKFEAEVNKRGGEMLWVSGNEGEARLSGEIKKSDVVVLMLQYMSHNGSKTVVELAKEQGKPHDNLQVLGKNAFINKVFEILEIDPME